MLAYAPFGFFVALLRRGASPAQRIGYSIAIGAAMSFAMESLQMYIPPRVASPLDLAANAVGAMLGGLVATALARSESTRDLFYRARARLFLPGHLGDVGLALMLLWLAAQTNPGIPLFAVTFDSDLVAPAGVVATAPPLQDDAASAAAHESASTVVQAAGTAFQVLGVGLFAALLLRRRRNTGTIVVALIVGALLLKGVAAAVMLKPAIWQSWFKPGALIGIAGRRGRCCSSRSHCRVPFRSRCARLRFCRRSAHPCSRPKRCPRARRSPFSTGITGNCSTTTA